MYRIRPTLPSRLASPAALASLLVLTSAVACTAESGEQGADTGAATAAAPSADSSMAGMGHSATGPATMTGMNRPAPRDSNQVFLRMMSDHHEGLIAMADSAEERAQDTTTRADARELVEKQRREQQEMLATLRGQYQDSITPMVMPSNQAMLDSTLRASGTAFDPTFYRQLVHHHREGVAMAEPLLPHLTGEVRQMAERMIADQRREVEEFQRKAQAAPAG